jgi:hypothetical protein
VRSLWQFCVVGFSSWSHKKNPGFSPSADSVDDQIRVSGSNI